MKEFDDQIGEMETQLQRWGAKLDDLMAQAGSVGDDARGNYYLGIAHLKAKHAEARSTLAHLRTASRDTWQTVRASLESTCAELKLALARFGPD